MGNFKYQFMWWSIIVPICAAPSFLLAMKGFNMYGMLCGIPVIIAAYSHAVSSARYHHLKSRFPLFHHSLGIAYVIRIILSLIQLSWMSIDMHSAIGVLLPDIFAGMAANLMLQPIGSAGAPGFLFTLLTTLADAAIMSIAVLVLGFIICTFRHFFIVLVKGLIAIEGRNI